MPSFEGWTHIKGKTLPLSLPKKTCREPSISFETARRSCNGQTMHHSSGIAKVEGLSQTTVQHANVAARHPKWSAQMSSRPKMRTALQVEGGWASVLDEPQGLQIRWPPPLFSVGLVMVKMGSASCLVPPASFPVMSASQPIIKPSALASVSIVGMRLLTWSLFVAFAVFAGASGSKVRGLHAAHWWRARVGAKCVDACNPPTLSDQLVSHWNSSWVARKQVWVWINLMSCHAVKELVSTSKCSAHTIYQNNIARRVLIIKNQVMRYLTGKVTAQDYLSSAISIFQVIPCQLRSCSGNFFWKHANMTKQMSGNKLCGHHQWWKDHRQRFYSLLQSQDVPNKLVWRSADLELHVLPPWW